MRLNLGSEADQKKIINSIFTKAAEGSRIIKDAEPLRPDYVPPKLLFRDEQITAVAQIIAPILRKQRCSNVLLYGKTGTGKTATARLVLNELRLKAQEFKIPVCLCYTNCRLAGTEYRVVLDLAESIGVKIPFTGLSLGEAYSRVAAQISDNNLNFLVVLDEIDYLAKNSTGNLLYELTRSHEKLTPGGISLIGISNDLRFKEMLDPRVLSSLGEEEMVFPPYSVEELRLILKERVKLAFNDGCITEGAVNLCAALAGSEHGDARRAVDLLRVSAEVAEREGKARVEEHHIKIALQKMEQDRLIEALRVLPLQAKLILLSVIKSEDSSSTGSIYQTYLRLSSRVGVETLTARRVSGILSELDMQGLISANVLSKGRYGRSKRVSLLVSKHLVLDVLTQDPIIAAVI
ncbi:MAG: orc1/cdc6 family replication initiation protein [Nitrososphaerales archaeon]